MKKAILLVAAVALLAVLFSCGTGGGGRAAGPAGPILNAAGAPVSGTATGTAPGYSSEVAVTITIVDGIITEAIFDLSGETQAFVASILRSGPGEIVGSNRPEIDVVVGSTLSAEAVNVAAKAAVNAIIAASN